MKSNFWMREYPESVQETYLTIYETIIVEVRE